MQPHIHTAECYDAKGNLVCEQLETYEHTHSERCFVEAPRPLTCTLPEDENHTHTEQCYGEWELICGLPEHIHTEECYKSATPAPEESDTEENADAQQKPAASSAAAVPAASSNPAASAANRPSNQKNGAPIDVKAYITTAKLKYQRHQESVWRDIAGETIPGNARLRLEATYDNVSVTELLMCKRQLVYKVPSLLRNPVAEGAIFDKDHQEIGVVAVSDNVLTMTFDQKWLEQLQANNSTEVSGSFNVESTVNISQIPGGGETELVIGDVVLKPNFEEDLLTKYGTANVEKAVSERVIHENGQDYLEYTLTLTAGPDGCQNVTVVDRFTANQKVVAYDKIDTHKTPLRSTGIPREVIQEGCAHGSVYKAAQPTTETPIPAPNDTHIVEPGSLVWEVNHLKANEVRTLTYRVKLLGGYSFLQNSGQKDICNQADVYSGTEQRDSDTAHFQPKAGMDMRKSHVNAVRNPKDGSYKMTYTVWIQAYGDNNFTLDNVHQKDSLHSPTNGTDAKVLPYISYVPDSFRLYQGKKPVGSKLPINGSDGPIPYITQGEDGKDFTLWVGDMQPGEAYCLQYDVRVGAEVFGAGNPEKMVVRNRAIAYADNARKTHMDNGLQAYNDTATIDYHHWAEKTAGNRIEQDLKIPMSGGIYDATVGDTPVAVEHPPKEFTVPAGSYQYSVRVNDLGDWDISQATIRDQLQSEHMKYVGFVRVDAYRPNAEAHNTPQDPAQTRWVKIEDLSQFAFSMGQIGLKDAYYAYQLTYYATPVNIDGISNVQVTNCFEISGQVGIGEETFTLTGIQTEVSVVVQGGYSFEAVKRSWYYETPQSTTGPWSKGAMYWLIQVDGSEVCSGVSLKDYVKPNSQMAFYEDSLVGVYTGSFPQDVGITDYANMDAAMASGCLKEVPAENYTVSFQNSANLPGKNAQSDVIVRMDKSVPLGSDTSMYIVLKAAPTVLPEANRASETYVNYLASSDNGSDWIERDTASKTLYGGENILKELGLTFTYDGNKITNGQVDHGGKIPEQALKEPGHYVSWAVKVNYAGNLSGRYRVVDYVPEGMEVAFARLKWLGDKTVNKGTSMCRIDNYTEELGADWTEHSITAKTDRDNKVTSYYYTNGNQVLWEVDPLIAGKERDRFAVDFQIVCRVTDPDVLLGGKTETFANRVELQTEQGIAVDSDSDSV